jgi:hypothetical protein
VTPFSSSGSVKLQRGDWNTQFIADLSNFPASDRDHSVDAFCHAMRAFVGTGIDFQKPKMLPGKQDGELVIDDEEYQSSFSADNDFDQRMSDTESYLRGQR